MNYENIEKFPTKQLHKERITKYECQILNIKVFPFTQDPRPKTRHIERSRNARPNNEYRTINNEL